MCENDMISREDYYEFHESKEDLYMPDDYPCFVECTTCGDMTPADEIFPIGHDRLCPEDAKAAGVYRCEYCGNVYEKKDFCPECMTEREEER